MLFVADQNQVVFNYESGTYANASGLSGCWLGLVTNHAPTDEESVVQIRYTGTSSRNVGQFVNTMKDYGGTITYHPQDFKMFGFALGSVVDSGSPTPYVHVISEVNSDNIYAYTSGTGRNNNFASFTILDSKKGPTDTHQLRTYKGCIVDSLSLTASQGEPLTCEMSYMAQSLSVIGSGADLPASIWDEDTSRPYLWSDVTFHKPSGTVVDEVTDVSFTINNNLERRHYDNGSKVVDNITPLNRDYEVSLTLDANSSDALGLYADNWQSGTTFNSMISAVISTGSEQGHIVMSGCKITSFESPSPAEGINEYSITYIPDSVIVNVDDLIEKYNPW